MKAAFNINIGGINPLTAPFTAATEGTLGSAMDQSIDQLMIILNNANVPLSVLITALADTPTPASASAALSGIVAANNIATSILAGCPYAPSGNYLVAGPGSTSFSQFTIDFSTMVATNVTTGQTFTIGLVAGSPCAYTDTSSTGVTTSIRVSQSGIAAGGVTPSSTSDSPGFTLLSTQGFYLLIPAQASTLANFPIGNMYGAGFLQAAGTTSQPWENYFFQYNWSSTDLGGGSGFVCPGYSANCTGGHQFTFATTGPNPDGTFTGITSDGNVFTDALYRSSSGDVVLVNVIKSSNAGIATFFQVATQRTSAFPTHIVGGTYSTNYWLLFNNYSNNAYALMQEAVNPTFTVNALGTAPLTETRTDQFGRTDTVYVNDPFPGMLLRPATADGSEWAGVTALGLNVFGSTQTGEAPSNTVPVYLGISIATP